jgi:hypothetical protein
LLERDHPTEIDALYEGQVEHERLEKVNTWAKGDILLYRIRR